MSENVLDSDESVKSEIFQGSTSNLRDINTIENPQPFETVDQSIESLTKTDDSINSRSNSSNDTKSNSRTSSNNNKTIRSTQQKKDKFNKDGVWSAIDTLDDVRKMAAENSNKDVFPAGFEDDLNTSRSTNATLLHIIRNRSERIAKEIRTSREGYKKEDFSNSNMNKKETSSRSGRRSRYKNEDKRGALSRSLSILNLGKKSANFSKSSNSFSNSVNLSNDKIKEMAQNEEYLSVNLSKQNIFSTDGSSSEVSDEESFSDATDEFSTNPRPGMKQERPPQNPLYISDYTDYQANVKQIARDEEEYVSKLIETVRASIPESTKAKAKQKAKKHTSKSKSKPNPTTKPRSGSRSSQTESQPVRAT